MREHDSLRISGGATRIEHVAAYAWPLLDHALDHDSIVNVFAQLNELCPVVHLDLLLLFLAVHASSLPSEFRSKFTENDGYFDSDLEVCLLVLQVLLLEGLPAVTQNHFGAAMRNLLETGLGRIGDVLVREHAVCADSSHDGEDVLWGVVALNADAGPLRDAQSDHRFGKLETLLEKTRPRVLHHEGGDRPDNFLFHGMRFVLHL